VTVLGRRIGVNAVTQQGTDIVQDYALVISSGDGQIADALTITEAPVAASAASAVTVVTNEFDVASGDFGSLLTLQRAGANSPWTGANSIPFPGGSGARLTPGDPGQWHFYVFTNTPGYTNVAFLTAHSKRTALAAGQVYDDSQEADIDLYVSTDPGLTNLDPIVLSNADFSTGRGGEEMIVYSAALPVTFYAGVKSETQAAAEYDFLAIASQLPFSQVDAQGNELLRGFSVPAPIPAGLERAPCKACLFAICPDSLPVRRVIVTNALSCPWLPDLHGALAHNGGSVVLRNHSGSGMVDDALFIYDDSSEGDITGAQPSDGPGSLLTFAGGDGFGQWHLDWTSTNHPGIADGFWIFLERQQDLNSTVSATILPGVCRQDYISLPAATTNLTAIVGFVSGTGPLSMQVCRADDPINTCLEVPMTIPGTNGVIMIDATSHPPLNPGNYFIRVCNSGPDAVEAGITTITATDVLPPLLQNFGPTAPVSPIVDDAVSASTIEVTNLDTILSLEVGVRIDHPRISDLALRLISPQGTEVLLDENRGGLSAGMGCNIVTTGTVSFQFSGGPVPITNVVDSGQTSGVIGINYDFYMAPDDMRVYYQGNRLFDSGLVSNTGSATIPYGPGTSTVFTIVMNENGNPDSSTAWSYFVTSTRLTPVYFTFTEDTNVASIPIKFAPTPLTNFNYFGTGNRAGNGIFYLPEESLNKFVGEPAFGSWRLEVSDTRSGATVPPGSLSWQLAFRFRQTVPVPIEAFPTQPVTNLLGAGQIQWFVVAPPSWVSFATNSLLTSSAPVNLLFNQSTTPTGTNAGDFLLLAGATSAISALRTNGSPALIAGTNYFLGIQNTNAATVAFVFQVDFDLDNLVTLTNGLPYSTNNPGPAGAVDYYRYVVGTNALRAQFEINGPSSDVTLLARKGPPPPSLTSFDYRSSNPGTNDELIVVYNYSGPVPLSPGEWYLTVQNVAGGPTTYSVMASEFPAYGTNILITDGEVSSNQFCLTWNSLPGVHYFLQGKNSLSDTNWVTLSPTLTAVDTNTSYCLTQSGPFDFYRVQEGLVITPPPLLIDSVSYGSQGVLLQWVAATNLQFHVQWTTSLDSPHWSTFSPIISSSNGMFSFLDDGSQSGGFGYTRFYRLKQLP
jgi:subtilisin-like proprotein convertase family protein